MFLKNSIRLFLGAIVVYRQGRGEAIHYIRALRTGSQKKEDFQYKLYESQQYFRDNFSLQIV